MIRPEMSVLEKNLQSAAKAKRWLLRSYETCKSIDFDKPVPDNRMDDLEALTGRFARFTDIMINKVFRSLEIAELETPETLIDTVNRMAKRGLVKSTESVRELKNLRNTISHEYEDEELRLIMKNCVGKAPELFEIFDRVESYCTGHGYLTPGMSASTPETSTKRSSPKESR
jgi:hypothetical protein